MDNKNLYCTVHFTYDGEVPEYQKEYLEKLFMALRNEVVNLLNPNYEKWNSEYEKEVNGVDDMEYNGYIREKQRSVLKGFNKKYEAMRDVMYLDSDEYADIIGVIPMYNNTIMHMSMKILNLEEWKEERSKEA